MPSIIQWANERVRTFRSKPIFNQINESSVKIRSVNAGQITTFTGTKAFFWAVVLDGTGKKTFMVTACSKRIKTVKTINQTQAITDQKQLNHNLTEQKRLNDK